MSLYEQGSLVVLRAVHFEEITVSTSAIGLDIGSVPVPVQDIRRILVQCELQPVRWLATGANPTSTSGFILRANDLLIYDGDPSTVKFIRDQAATLDSKVSVLYMTN